MKLHSIIVSVHNIDLAISFYTEKLYFKKKKDISKIDKKTGIKHRKVVLISEKSNHNVEIKFSTLVNSFKPLTTYRQQLFESGIPYIQFSVKNIKQEFERLINLGVRFSLKPTIIGLATVAVFEDDCGNHIQINEDI